MLEPERADPSGILVILDPGIKGARTIAQLIVKRIVLTRRPVRDAGSCVRGFFVDTTIMGSGQNQFAKC